MRFSNPKRAFIRRERVICEAIERVLASGIYVGGEEVRAFEREFAAYLGIAGCVAVGSGTGALEIALRALGIGPGDRVATVALTAVATVAAIELSGATPILVDVDPATLTMDPDALARLCERERIGAVVPVHLYGNPADMPRILAVANTHGVRVVEDCAQAHGASLAGCKCGTWGDAAAFSFYPTKNLGALGDGGAVVTKYSEVAERAALIREYGWRERQVSEIPGKNSRLDAIQAAVLRVKLGDLDDNNRRRLAIAGRYDEALDSASVRVPARVVGAVTACHQYVVRSCEREKLRVHLQAHGIESTIHYPQPVHLQPAYRTRIAVAGPMHNTEQACREVLSIPCFPELTEDEVDAISVALRTFAGARSGIEAAPVRDQLGRVVPQAGPSVARPWDESSSCSPKPPTACRPR